MNKLDCGFCDNPKNLEREIIRTDLAWAFPTMTPIVPGHTLVCPIRHVATFDELTPEELTAIFDLAEKLKLALIKTFDASGFNFAWNESEIAGQTVPHFHLHIVPRKKGDAGIYEYEPRQFLYRPGSREETPQQELVQIAHLIRSKLK